MQPLERRGPLVAEGAAYARALLERIASGTSSPDDLATIVQFLHSGDMLHGACVVLYEVLRLAMRRPAAT